jgi:hypothetical protein
MDCMPHAEFIAFANSLALKSGDFTDVLADIGAMRSREQRLLCYEIVHGRMLHLRSLCRAVLADNPVMSPTPYAPWVVWRRRR